MDPRRLYFQGNVEGPTIQTLFETGLAGGDWVNFGVVLDFDRKCVRIILFVSFCFAFLRTKLAHVFLLLS